MVKILDKKSFSAYELADLFGSVGWASANYPERLQRAMLGYGSVFSAYDGEKLAGLIAAMDDGEMTAYIHYLLVRPEYQNQGVGMQLLEAVKRRYADYLRIVLCGEHHAEGFYVKAGFERDDNASPMYWTKYWG